MSCAVTFRAPINTRRIYLFDKTRYAIRTSKGVERKADWNEATQTFVCVSDHTRSLRKKAVALEEISAVAVVSTNGLIGRFYKMDMVYLGKFAPRDDGPKWVHPIRQRILAGGVR